MVDIWVDSGSNQSSQVVARAFGFIVVFVIVGDIVLFCFVGSSRQRLTFD